MFIIRYLFIINNNNNNHLLIYAHIYIRPTALEQKNSTMYKLFEIQPTGPARRLATQQVGYD